MIPTTFGLLIVITELITETITVKPLRNNTNAANFLEVFPLKHLMARTIAGNPQKIAIPVQLPNQRTYTQSRDIESSIPHQSHKGIPIAQAI